MEKEGHHLPESELAYVDFHKYRYRYLLELIQGFVSENAGRKLTLLDIGPAYQTRLVRHFFPDLTVHSIGYKHPANELRVGEEHFDFDLNDADQSWPEDMPPCDLILFCEVIEHIYTPPEIILDHLQKLLARDGWLIIQTPNAVAIQKRLGMAFGRNPYQLLHKNKMGHFREYTLTELKTMLLASGLDEVLHSRQNYFNPSQHLHHQIFRKLGNVLPAAWRDGITVVATPVV